MKELLASTPVRTDSSGIHTECSLECDSPSEAAIVALLLIKRPSEEGVCSPRQPRMAKNC
jgi:hypothetical protein